MTVELNGGRPRTDLQCDRVKVPPIPRIIRSVDQLSSQLPLQISKLAGRDVVCNTFKCRRFTHHLPKKPLPVNMATFDMVSVLNKSKDVLTPVFGPLELMQEQVRISG